MVYEQFLYFWFVWIIFIIVAFFMKNGKKRSFLLFWILLLIFISQTYVTIGAIQFSFAYFVLLIGSIIFFIQHSLSWYNLMVAFCVVIGYVSLLIWEKITPIWFFMPSFFQIPVLIVMIVLLLVQSYDSQITSAILGLILGRIIFELLLIVYRLHDVVGEETFFIHISLTVLFIIVVRLMQSITSKIANFFRRKLI